MIRNLLILLALFAPVALVGCGGKSPQPFAIDRPAATVGEFILSGSQAGETRLGDEALLARHNALETVTLAGADAERLGAARADGTPGLALIREIVIMTSFDDEADVEVLLGLAREARVRWALGIPTGTEIKIHPEFGDLTAVSGDSPVLLFDLERARWGGRNARVRNVRVSRVTNGSVYSFPSGHIVFAALRGNAAQPNPALETSPFGKSFEQLRTRPQNPVVSQPTADQTAEWLISLDSHSIFLSAPGGMAISNAVLERRTK